MVVVCLVSVPTEDFSFIYLVDFGEEILAGEQFPSPPGTFLLSIGNDIVSTFEDAFPSPLGTFLLSIR